MNIQKFEPITISIEFDTENQALPTKAGIALLHDSDDLSFAAQHSSILPFNTWQTNFVGFNSIYTKKRSFIRIQPRKCAEYEIQQKVFYIRNKK
mgnify:CR=1 FL=1